MRRLSHSLTLSFMILPTMMRSFAQADQTDIAKYADPNIEVNQVFDAGAHGAVLVTSLNVLPNNDLLCITDATRAQAARLGVKIAGRVATLGWISKNNGRTWGSPVLVLDGAVADREPADPTIIVTGGKVIVIASMGGRPQPPLEYGDSKLWQVTSTDNGQTWIRPSELKIPRTRPALSGRQGLVLADRTIIVPYWWDFQFQTGMPEPTCVSGVLRSNDGGLTWELSSDVYAEWSVQPKRLSQAAEPAIVALSEKDIFMVARSSRTDGLAHETWSHDGGRSWEPPRAGALPGYDTPTALWRMKNGWVVRICDYSKVPLHRFPLVASISKDHCRTWSSPRKLVDLPADTKWPAQAAYPVVVEAADGVLVATWCQVLPGGSKWIVASGRFTADWVLGRQ
jgi:hypothetical protein